MNEKIGVIGLGKLGLPMLSAFIKKGFNTLGYDINAAAISELQQRKITIKEDGIEEIMKNDSLWESRFTNNIDKIFNFADVLFVIVPTPSKSDGTFNLSFVESVTKQINSLCIENQTKKTIVITSTVNPGDCDELSKKYSFVELVYSPEFIALGSVLKDMLNPCTCIIGSNDVRLSQKIKLIYEKLYDTKPEYSHLKFYQAEIAKIAINSYITMKISFANTIGSLIYDLSEGDLSAVSNTLRAIGSDDRINNKYFKFGTGYGGPCFPRDNRCLSMHLKSRKINDILPNATDLFNKWLLEFFAKKIVTAGYDNIVYVGVSYKKNSDFLEESFILNLHDLIKEHSKKYYFFDDKVNSYQGLIKLHDINESLTGNTLYLINYCDQASLEKIKDKHVFNFWS